MKTVIGVFKRYADADEVIRILHDLDIQSDDIGLAVDEEVVEEYGVNDNDNGAATGVMTGGVAGLLLGVSAITLPGFAPVLAVGALAAVLGSTVVGAGVGGMVGTLVDVGMTEEQAKRYVKIIEQRGFIISVQVDESKEPSVIGAMHKSHATNVDSFTTIQNEEDK